MLTKVYILLIASFVYAVTSQQYETNLTYSSNEFCFDLLKTFPEHQNVFFSPTSIYIALGMLFAGAKTSTAEIMRNVLKYDEAELNEVNIHQSFGNLIEMLNNGSDEYKLQIANSLLYQQDHFILPQFKETLQNYYSALLRAIDISGDSTGAIEEINSWVNRKTNGKITELIKELPPNAVMVLLNAIYFKGTWKKTFDSESTRNVTFYNDGVHPVSVPMMYQEDEFPYAYLYDEGLQAIELPYKGEHISMLVILPTLKDKLDEVESKLNNGYIKNIISQLRRLKLEVNIPKFKLEDSRKLKGNLTYLGMEELFSRNADFSGISGEKNLKVSDVVHKATIEVNEEGSEASAATGVVIVTYSAKPTFYADHPFLFLIRDRRTDLILFVGRVNRL